MSSGERLQDWRQPSCQPLGACPGRRRCSVASCLATFRDSSLPCGSQKGHWLCLLNFCHREDGSKNFQSSLSILDQKPEVPTVRVLSKRRHATGNVHREPPQAQPGGLLSCRRPGADTELRGTWGPPSRLSNPNVSLALFSRMNDVSHSPGHETSSTCVTCTCVVGVAPVTAGG